MVLQVVLLSANGESRQSRVTSTEVTEATVTKLCRKTKPAVAVCTYEFGELTLTIWGWKEGKAGTENKHELPPPLEEGLLFGDAVVSAVATEDDSAQSFTVAQWEEFYKDAFKGFHDTAEGSDSDDESESAGEDAEEEDGDAEEDEEEAGSDKEDESEAGSGEEDEDAEEEEEEEEDAECYDDGEEGGGGGGKRRAPRRRTATAPEYRRMDMGLRSRVKVPMPVGKRAPRWQTAPELEEETY
jgi:hypothetical protein